MNIDKAMSRNAASCMTSILCNRLATSGREPEKAANTTYHWDDGIINLRNAVKSWLWTNLRLNWVRDFHAMATNRPAVYLMACWEPGEAVMDVWAIPESVMFECLPRHPVARTEDKRTVQIKANSHRFEQCTDSPDLKPFHRRLSLTPDELKLLNRANETDSLVKLQRKAEADREPSGPDVPDEGAFDRTDQLIPSSENDNLGPRYWAISLGEGGRLWNECQEKSIICIGWDQLGDLRNYASQQIIADKLRSMRSPGAPEPHNDSLACFEFARVMARDDYVAAKIGRNRLVGIGVVQSDYIYEPTRTEYHHVRHVRWIRAQNLALPDGASVPVKTLTDVSHYEAFVAFVRENLLATEIVDTGVAPETLEPFTL